LIVTNKADFDAFRAREEMLAEEEMIEE